MKSSFDQSFSGPGGKIVVFETSKAGRLTDGVYPSFINGVLIYPHSSFHPLRHFRGTFLTLTLTRSTRTGWFVPSRTAPSRFGLCRKEASKSRSYPPLSYQQDPCYENWFQVNEPTSTFAAHGDKVSIVKFHPTAEVRKAVVRFG